MKVLIAISKSKPSATEKALLLQTYLSNQKIDSITVDVDEMINCSPQSALPENLIDDIKDVSLATTLGGDGTILRTARLLFGKEVPILGINLGTLGFLANDINDNLFDLTAKALAGELICERRTNLMCDIICQDETDWILDGGEKLREPTFALNEVAITRGGSGVMLDMNLEISDAVIGRFKGDGMIVSSATGSTAYSLAAGGPIVAPSFHGMIVQPLASHTISARTVLTNENDVVKLSLITDESTLTRRKANVYIDGVDADVTSPVKTVYVRRGSVPTILLYESANTTLKKATETFFRGL